MEDKWASFKVAVVQAAPVAFDRERTLAKVHSLAGEAARASVSMNLSSVSRNTSGGSDWTVRR